MDNESTNPQTPHQQLYRPTGGRALGGVASAIAEQAGASVGLIRLAFVATAMIGGLGIVLYAAAWALLPGEGEDASPMELWLRNLKNPGKQLGALLIGAAVLILLNGAHHTAIVAAATVLGIAVLAAQRPPAGTKPNAGVAGNETE